MQYYYMVATLARAARQTSSFTYQCDQPLKIGALVKVEVGKKLVSGVVVASCPEPSFPTKAISSVLDLPALPEPLLLTAQWLQKFYHSHEAAIWQTILPAGLGKKRRKASPGFTHPMRDQSKLVLTTEQQAAVAKIASTQSGTLLLQGVTGSGKTQVYIEAAKQTLSQKRSVIVLVPEIALTSQLIADFTQHFTDVLVTHSTMTEAQRYSTWEQCLVADKPLIVIGPRSALFSPLHNLGLIIVDECHEPSFKQEQMPRYSALRTASVLANYHDAKLILGSATPSIVDRFFAEKTGRPIIHLNARARTGALEPQIHMVDMKKREHFTKHRFISNKLIAAIQQSLEKKEQALIFHNRRGNAPTTLCESCAWTAACPRCFIPLTLHNDAFQLRCHVCNYSQSVPTSCPQCGAAEVIHKGVGTKSIEEALRSLFPKAKVQRFDGDSTADATVDKLYQQLYDGQIDIIVGTQVIAKGLDLPHLHTVGIIQADSGLTMPDFQSSERVFQLLSQVRGRVGRTENLSTLIVQSFQPTDPSVLAGVNQQYEKFYQATLALRRKQLFPPFCYLLKLTCAYKTEAAAVRNAREFAKVLRGSQLAITVMGPAPAFYERIRDTYRWQLIIKSHDRKELLAALSFLPAGNWQYELDPTTLL
ncbi:MAG TPA: primosomal protein N' [Candidatus Saccharimonadales bacterium]